MKRAFDIVAALLTLLVGLPLFMAVTVIIVAEDPGSPFFVQTRVGQDGENFRMVKFRTMYKDAEERKAQLLAQNDYDSVHFKCDDDVRLLKCGKALRRHSLDELPQLLNIIKNDMSFVGPRPFVPEEQAQLPPGRLAVKPGLSCYWQLADKHGMSDAEQLELDYRYIRERSLRTDLRIIGGTLSSVFHGKNI